MDFFEEQALARKRTVRLGILFALAVGLHLLRQLLGFAGGCVQLVLGWYFLHQVLASYPSGGAAVGADLGPLAIVGCACHGEPGARGYSAVNDAVFTAGATAQGDVLFVAYVANVLGLEPVCPQQG